jgi:hypothetical protein
VNVADLAVKQPDSAGAQIVAIYARNPPLYAVYRTAHRVCVHLADDPAKAEEQRKALAQLAPVRGEINGLMDGWRCADLNRRVLRIGPKNGAKLRDKAERYDRRVGDALVVALEGDLTGAGTVLASIKDEIKDERIGWARFEYLVLAFIVAFSLMLIALAVALTDRPDRCAAGQMFCFVEAWDLWRGMAAGAFGAFFSIALAIRGRTVLTDLYRTSNLMDAGLRITIGTIAGAVLVALTETQFVRVYLGDSAPGHYYALHILVVGFIGGFAERLVPDLLAKAEARTGEPAVIRQPEPNLAAARVSGSANGPATPAGAGSGPAGPPGGPPPSDPVPQQALEDSCIARTELADEEVTADEDLPPASGGVEKPQEVVA